MWNLEGTVKLGRDCEITDLGRNLKTFGGKAVSNMERTAIGERD